MTDFLVRMGLSNAFLSLALAIAATVVGAGTKRPQLVHMLWLLVFVKLVTPPIVTVPVVTIPADGGAASTAADHSRLGPVYSEKGRLNNEAPALSGLGSAAWNHARVWMPPIWLVGSVVVLARSLVRIHSFSRLLAMQSEVAPPELQTDAKEMGYRLGLRRIPTIYVTSARISPMVWWTGGEVRVFLPATLFEQMDPRQSQWILAHELAHVRRRDYLVRWLEWLACVCFWWNLVVWWAQRNLRATEEICCDELVMSRLNPKPKIYANSLLSALEFLARPALRPPAMASQINSGGFLERRFKMIVSKASKRSNSRWLNACVLLCAVVLLPVGIASAQDYKAVERRLGEAVANGEISLEQAGIMMDALRRAGGGEKQPAKSKSDANLEKAGGDVAKKSDASGVTIQKTKAAGITPRLSKHITGEHYAREEVELKRLVTEGKMSKEDFRSRLNGMREKIGPEEEGAAKKGAVKKIGSEDFAQGKTKSSKAIAVPKKTIKQGPTKIAPTGKKIGDKAKGFSEKNTSAEGIKKRVKGDVKRTDTTKEKADAKQKAIRDELSHEAKDKGAKDKNADSGK